MKPFTELNLGFTNAENYRKRSNKELLERYFVRDEYLEKLLDNNIYFLIGEKGTGKTAYSTYMRNGQYKGRKSFTYDVRQTEYMKFLELKKSGFLPLSRYTEIWRTLLLILSATSIIQSSHTPEFLKRFTKLNDLKAVLDEFYDHAFSPEIIKIINFIESSELSSSLMAKHGFEVGAKSKSGMSATDPVSIFQTNLMDIRNRFEDVLRGVKLSDDHILFIDGIDVRPADISYSDYFDCVRGLTESVWALNNDLFGDIRDTAGRIRIVLLVRPDIFLRAGLHNTNTKIRDNSVVLGWSTTYKDYRSSSLFKVADRLLGSQSDKPLAIGKAWDHYFPFFAENVKASEVSKEGSPNSFLAFLRFSYYRPRDINAMLATMKEIVGRRGVANYITAEDFSDPSFRDAHADYLLGELHDQLLFYYSQDEFDLFLEFFSHLKGRKRFSYVQFVDSFGSFIRSCIKSGKQTPKFFESADVFLQFLYEQNVICYIETDDEDKSPERFIRWCFRERTPSNLAPKVRLFVDYEIFYGLTKALNVGRLIRTRERIDTNREVGSVVRLVTSELFGFIRGGVDQTDYYFKFDQLTNGFRPTVGDRVSYEVVVKYGKLRAQAIRRC